MSDTKVALTRAASMLTPDGVNTFIFELGPAMLKMGIKVYIISGYDSNFSKAVISKLFDVYHHLLDLTLINILLNYEGKGSWQFFMLELDMLKIYQPP